MERDDANACRFVAGDPRGHYESWFQRANHPTRALAFWIRYTVFAPRGRPQDAVGERWAIWFDGEAGRIVATKRVVPIADCAFSSRGLEVRIGHAALAEGRLEGDAQSAAHRIDWRLAWRGEAPPLLLLPPAWYAARLPKAKALVGAPLATYDGEIVVDGQTQRIDGWIGSQNHNWGRQHTDAYAWGQVAGFDEAADAFLECSTARLRFGPLWTPPLSLAVLRLGRREWRFTGARRALTARGQYDFKQWTLATTDGATRLSVRFDVPPDGFVGLRYDNPPGGAKTCLNSKLAACTVRLDEPGRAPLHLRSAHRAAFEILTDRSDHGVAVVA